MAGMLSLLGAGSGASSGGLTPDQVSGLRLWLKSDTQTYQDSGFSTPATADGDPVGGWKDQSGGARDVTQATSASRGTLKLSQVNGKPVVRFDGTDDFLEGVAISNLIAAAAFTLFV